MGSTPQPNVDFSRSELVNNYCWVGKNADNYFLTSKLDNFVIINPNDELNNQFGVIAPFKNPKTTQLYHSG